MCEKFNGWTNRETWLVNLWINNDESTYNKVKKIRTAEGLKKFIYSNYIEQESAGLAEDLLNGAFLEINFKEIFEALNETSIFD